MAFIIFYYLIIIYVLLSYTSCYVNDAHGYDVKEYSKDLRSFLKSKSFDKMPQKSYMSIPKEGFVYYDNPKPLDVWPQLPFYRRTTSYGTASTTRSKKTIRTYFPFITRTTTSQPVTDKNKTRRLFYRKTLPRTISHFVNNQSLTSQTATVKVVSENVFETRSPITIGHGSTRRPGSNQTLPSKHNSRSLKLRMVRKLLKLLAAQNDTEAIDTRRSEQLRSVPGHCYECGLRFKDPKLRGGNSSCYEVQTENYINILQRLNFRHDCSDKDYKVNGCFKRFVDVGTYYYERGCRSKDNPEKDTSGKTYASERLVKLESLLINRDEGCVTSPVATLTPFSKAVSLFAHYTVCVCQGNYCNNAIRHETIVLPVLLIHQILLFYTLWRPWW